MRADVRRVALFTAAALILVAAMAGTGVWWLTRPGPPAVVRATITAPGSAALIPNGFLRDVAITPDGSRVVYRGNNRLLVRALNELQPTELTGVGVPNYPFVSPDGQWIGFFDGLDTLKRVSITGGPSQIVCATGQGAPSGATWGPDGTIIFATTGRPATGLQRVSAAGGKPTVLTKVDRERGEGSHGWPQFLPGGEAVLFTIMPATLAIENAQVAVLDLRTGTTKPLINGGSHAQYVPTGHLVYGVGGTLRAVAFDLGRLEVVGTPAPVLEGVMMSDFGAVNVAIAANGSLVYVPGGAGANRRTVVSVDRQGRPSPLPGLPLDLYRTVDVSPDGTRLALGTADDVSIYDFARATFRRLTTDPALDTSPKWTPDSRGIIFTSERAGYPELFRRQADGTGSDEQILGRAKDLLDLVATGWSKDGGQLLFSEVQQSLQCAIGQIPIERPSDVKLLVQNDSCNSGGAVSPDGRWIAYTSIRSGRSDVWVDRYPELGSPRQISTGGGAIPVWSLDGRELFFSTADARQMFAVPVQSGTTLDAGRSQLLFEFAMLPVGGGNLPYDIAPDGRFLIIRNAQAEAGVDTEPQIVLVQNWFTDLKQRVPTR